MNVRSTRAISACSLSSAWINVNIAFLSDFSCFLLIIFRESLKRVKEDIFCFFVGVFLIGFSKLEETIVRTMFF